MMCYRQWFLTIWPLLHAQCKFQTNLVKVGGQQDDEKWAYISKFGYTIGEGSYAVRLKYADGAEPNAGRVRLTLDIFLDEDWADVEALPPCSRARHSRASKYLDLDPNGGWGMWQNGTVFQSVRSHVWYFSLSACGPSNYGMNNITRQVQFEARFLQADKSEFSVELKGMLTFHVMYILGFTSFLFKYFSFCRSYVRSAESLHPVIWVLSGAIGLQYLGEVLRADHLWDYSTNGLGVQVVELLSEICFTTSQVLLTSLLITIGMGYTLLQSKMAELEKIVPLVVLIAIVHIFIVSFAKLKDDASFKFHDHEGATGWVLLLLRLVLYIWFVGAVKKTANDAGMRLQLFLDKFLIAGSLYFLAFPILFVAVQIFAPYLQHKILTGGLLFVQTGTNLWLAHLLLSRGEYFKVSTLSSSFLPGGAKVGITKQD
eukprot:gnl/MRDRNA2_/MRDRNA2_122668_c0_seq1.p1 gnl/MRDRNA2_/MRDRNA2_122668_c0~~gnl/MRDRNA2_/MRDRNA2_122668_c0_seq1.p1  ORF type:complete len:429 (-),score=57.65 gnl/MRDRNA2_/MRDRNA2_122668_c0_seq1:48-1334(-)